jgi:protein-tyrosine phosphatase
LIDIHHHCLPGVDDGPRTMDEAVALCAISRDEGIETIVATPHVLRGRWPARSRAQFETALEELRERTGDVPHLLLGSEYFFAHDMTEVLHAGEKIVPLAGGRYVLVEFASNNVPPMVEQPLHRTMLEGFFPIVAHPERNLVFQEKPSLLRALARIGVKMQVTCGSITGQFGETAQECALAWLREGLVHFVATDAHSESKRPPRFREARERVEEEVGPEVARALFVDNPRAVIEGKGLPYDPDLPDVPQQAPRLIDRLRGLMRI